MKRALFASRAPALSAAFGAVISLSGCSHEDPADGGGINLDAGAESEVESGQDVGSGSDAIDGNALEEGSIPSTTCATGGNGPTTAPVAYTGGFANTTGDQGATLTVSGAEREVFLYVPSNVGAQPPLLVALHCTGMGTELNLRQDMASQFVAMADAHGMIVAAPEARLQPDGDWDQHFGGEKYWETMAGDDPSRGCDPTRSPDLLLVRAIIQEAKAAFGVDPKRIYLAGFSNGAFFTVAASVALRDQIAAFLEMSGGLVQCDNTNSCSFTGSSTSCAALQQEPQYCSCTQAEKPITLPTEGRMPPGYISHGNQDDVVSVAYSCALAARMQVLGHTTLVAIRDGSIHEMPDLADPGVQSEVWNFFAQHPLP